MEYSIGKINRAVLIKFTQDDDIINNIQGMCAKEGICSAIFYVIGGINNADIVSGPAKERFPLEPIFSTIDKKSEILGIGTVFMADGAPMVHLHAAVAKGDKIKVGCLRGMTKSFLITEIVLLELTGIDAKRVLDDQSGFKLLNIFGGESPP